ncbi:hypothetical protein [Xenorhabdus ishibashii]|uniref:Uncharacterized protein n=1 Tax=Xenorhabdus ishibashii TaxID=1034471 RepID=A0A2D0KI70_9GAMM|nr:hypothetical protein [Xenorhabdus ishibashii]PHM63005.1 hypothetical protein Xish_02232 [Xenorhabdus ishibashii]
MSFQLTLKVEHRVNLLKHNSFAQRTVHFTMTCTDAQTYKTNILSLIKYTVT